MFYPIQVYVIEELLGIAAGAPADALLDLADCWSSGVG
jgi:hypothetical protein